LFVGARSSTFVIRNTAGTTQAANSRFVCLSFRENDIRRALSQPVAVSLLRHRAEVPPSKKDENVERSRRKTCQNWLDGPSWRQKFRRQLCAVACRVVGRPWRAPSSQLAVRPTATCGLLAWWSWRTPSSQHAVRPTATCGLLAWWSWRTPSSQHAVRPTATCGLLAWWSWLAPSSQLAVTQSVGLRHFGGSRSVGRRADGTRRSKGKGSTAVSVEPETRYGK